MCMLKIKFQFHKNLICIWCMAVWVVVFCSQALAVENITPGDFEPLEKKLVADGFDASEIQVMFNKPEVFFNVKSVYRFFIHNESKLNYDQFTANEVIENAKKYKEEYHHELSAAQNETGVDKNIITAIILVETRLGEMTGNSNVFNTLSTMASLDNPIQREQLWASVSESGDMTKEAFEKKADKKAAWAYKELKAFIQYTSREKIEPSSITGSYAGAVGIAQFMPTNILTLAKDGNNDNKIDLFNHADAIFSIANYLKHSGWQPNIDKQQAAKVVYHYNHSTYYVNTILKIAELLKGNK